MDQKEMIKNVEIWFFKYLKYEKPNVIFKDS